MKKIDIGYIGFSEKMIKKLIYSEYFILKTVILQSDRKISKQTLQLLEDKNILIIKVQNKDDLKDLEKKVNCKKFIMYKFGFILPKNLVQNLEIFNIHYGYLRNNRGAHSLNWTILLREKQTCLSLYKVKEQIDLGLLIGEFTVNVSENDSTITLERKLEEHLKDVEKDLYKYFTNKIKGVIIKEGEYRPKIKENDYTINPYKDNLGEIKAKINSQKAYKGAILICNNKKFYVIDVEEGSDK